MKEIKKINLDLDMSGEKNAGKKIANGMAAVGTINTKFGMVKMDGMLRKHRKENFEIKI